MNKPALIIRIHNYNKVSIGAIFGACEPQLLENFELAPWVSTEPIPPAISNERALLIYSFMHPHMQQIEDELAQLRQQFPHIEAVAGGAQPTSAPQCVEKIGFDYVVAGEAEEFFPEFLFNWLEDLTEKRIYHTPRGLVNLSRYPGFSEITQYLPPIEISRGCRFGCMFCGVPWLNAATLRHRSLESIASIVREYFRIKVSRKRIKFLAPNAFAYGSDGLKPNLEALHALLETLKAEGVPEIHLGSFPSEIRPDFVTREVMELVTPYLSNKTIVMGVQTGSNKMLKKMNRGHTREDSVNAISLLREFGFTPHVDFIVGNPGETEQDQFEMLDFMEEMIEKYAILIHLHAFVPLPATPWADREQAPINEEVKKRLRALERAKVLDGWWENHIGYFRHSRA